GQKFDYRTGFCLEAQHFPDSPNHPHFPMTILMPDQIYRQDTIFKFTVVS
ncbi:MAG TPA: galactose-1-epimerase, partial [Caldithrix abyssi]|nr:galactose-1-epimerase [Caldithrix abyssi]